MSVGLAFDTAPELRCEAGPLAVWFTDPPGVVLQLTEAAVFTKEMAEWMVGRGFALLKERFPHNNELSILLDLRRMTSREPAAHPVVMAAAMQHLFMFAKVGVIAPLKPQPLYMTTLHGAVALLSAIGPEIRIYDTLEDALQTMNLTPSATTKT